MLDTIDSLGTLAPGLALREAAPFLSRLIATPRLRGRVGQLLDAAPERATAPEFDTVAQAGGCVLELFVWPRGARTPIHDHTSWGIYVCLAGQLGEERYVRLDDGAQNGVAHLRRDWRAVWQPMQQSSLLPYAGGIHRVANAGLDTSVSLHLYGPRLGNVDGRDYDPNNAFVCDRPLLAA